jgi:hypothetical protein
MIRLHIVVAERRPGHAPKPLSFLITRKTPPIPSAFRNTATQINPNEKTSAFLPNLLDFTC